MLFKSRIFYFLTLLMLTTCGKKGDLSYDGDSAFPRTYPSQEEDRVAEAQQLDE